MKPSDILRRAKEIHEEQPDEIDPEEAVDIAIVGLSGIQKKCYEILSAYCSWNFDRAIALAEKREKLEEAVEEVGESLKRLFRWIVMEQEFVEVEVE